MNNTSRWRSLRLRPGGCSLPWSSFAFPGNLPFSAASRQRAGDGRQGHRHQAGHAVAPAGGGTVARAGASGGTWRSRQRAVGRGHGIRRGMRSRQRAVGRSRQRAVGTSHVMYMYIDLPNPRKPAGSVLYTTWRQAKCRTNAGEMQIPPRETGRGSNLLQIRPPNPPPRAARRVSLGRRRNSHLSEAESRKTGVFQFPCIFRLVSVYFSCLHIIYITVFLGAGGRSAESCRILPPRTVQNCKRAGGAARTAGV